MFAEVGLVKDGVFESVKVEISPSEEVQKYNS